MHAWLATFLDGAVSSALIRTSTCAQSSPHCPVQRTPVLIPTKWTACLAVSLILPAVRQAPPLGACPLCQRIHFHVQLASPCLNLLNKRWCRVFIHPICAVFSPHVTHRVMNFVPGGSNRCGKGGPVSTAATQSHQHPPLAADGFDTTAR